MKALQLILAISFILIIASCKKSESNSVNSVLSFLQHKWTVDSLVAYQNANHTGQRQKEVLSGYEDFRNDGKRYGYSNTQGSTPNYDTSQYTLTSNNLYILDRSIDHGIVSPVSDTLQIDHLDLNRLVLSPPSNSNSGIYVQLFLHR